MAYALLFLALLIWAVAALRDRSLRHYLPLYVTGDVLAYVGQFVLSGVLGLYEYRAGWLADPFHDFRLMAFFVALGIDPLMVVLYARYCRRHPFWTAVLAALVVALLEWLFWLVGAMVYPVGWEPLLTFAISIPAFLLIWALDTKRIPLPLWAHVDAMAFWVTMPLDVLVHGAFWLLHYESPISFTGDIRADSRILAVLYAGFFQAPVATIAALGPWRRRWLAVGAAWVLLMGVELAGLMTGLIFYHGWNLGFTALAYGLTAVVPMLYARWFLARPEERKVRKRPPPWEPPV